MSTGDKAGLLAGFLSWVVEGSWVQVWVKCVFVTIGIHLLVGLVLEGRFVPLWHGQFRSFFPGDLLLSAGVATLKVIVDRLPEGAAWYNSLWLHVPVLALTCVVALAMTYGDLKGDAYSFWAVFSPTKLYHNLVLYSLFGYLAFAMLIVAGASVVINGRLLLVGLLLVALAFGGVWAFLTVKEGSDPEGMKHKAATAHIEDWRILGLIGPKSSIFAAP